MVSEYFLSLWEKLISFVNDDDIYREADYFAD